MQIGILHLSDIHFTSHTNPIDSRLSGMVAAMRSITQECNLLLLILSGDIANLGAAAEYDKASAFLSKLCGLLKDGKSVIDTCVVPGNHDCLLPKEEVTLRSALIQGLVPSLVTSTPDDALLSQVLKAQGAYQSFRIQVDPQQPPNQLFNSRLLQYPGVSLQLNLYNTALLSRRDEKQGELLVPMKLIADGISASPKADLSISVFHHPYNWLESNVAIDFRGHIERTSDLVFTGHQHFQHAFSKANSTGERVRYFEGAPLQDENNRQSSAFSVLLLDTAASRQRLVSFRWSTSLHKITHDSDWGAYERNLAIRSALRLSATFSQYLSDLGTPFRHHRTGPLTLADIFVMPNLQVRPITEATSTLMAGAGVLTYIREKRKVILQAPPMAGKTTLLKNIVKQLFDSGEYIPLVLDGSSVRKSSRAKIPTLFWRTFQQQYDPSMTEEYQQLPKALRILIIDDWHRAALNADGRRKFLQDAEKYFDALLLFVDDMLSLQEIIDKSPTSFFTFDHAVLMEFGAELRGRLIEKWVSLGQEYTASSRDLAREVEDSEALVRNMLRNNILPSRPFIILSLLQAAQEGRGQSTEAGSFGYLYEVLVTTALSATQTATPQLEKKYVLLAMIAYEMFKKDVPSLSESRVREIATEYAHAHLIRIDIDGILSDLTNVRALVNNDGNYTFGYIHLFYFFVARYYKDHLARNPDAKLENEIEHMVDHIGSDRYSTILLFIVYFSRNTTSVIKRLVGNANRIYADLPPADLVGGISFIKELPTSSSAEVPEENADLAEGRKRRRRAAEKSEKERLATSSNTSSAYSDDLPDGAKFKIGAKHIELLGQVLRNFPASLPGPEKIEILRSSYLLGLRMITNILKLLTQLDAMAREAERTPEELDGKTKRYRDVIVEIGKHIGALGRFATLGMISKVSGSVGVADLEDAYEATVQAIGATDAIRLIDLAIRLDHFKGFPEPQVRDLHREFRHRNPFADRLLLDLVLGNMIVYGVERVVRLRMMSEFNLKPNIAGMLESAIKQS
jgi:hypothetical protein